MNNLIERRRRRLSYNYCWRIERNYRRSRRRVLFSPSPPKPRGRNKLFIYLSGVPASCAYLRPLAHFPSSFALIVIAFFPVHRLFDPVTRLVRYGGSVRILTVHVSSLHRWAKWKTKHENGRRVKKFRRRKIFTGILR